MVDREALYRRLPIAVQNLVCSLEGHRIQRTRFGAQFRQLLTEAEHRDTWTSERLQRYRNRCLAAYIQYSAAHVSFYRRWFAVHKIDPRDLRTLSDLGTLPIINKRIVQEHLPDFVSTAAPKRDQVAIRTSGTTGAGLRLPATRDAIRQQWATWWRYRRWHGLVPDTWCGYFGGRTVVPARQSSPPFWRYNVPGRQLLFSAYHMSPRHLTSYIDELRTTRPPWLHGYPSLLALLARHIVDHNADIGYQVRWVTVGAENLLSHQSCVIERAFHVPPRQHYGMAEAIANISECEHGTLHVDEDFSAVEFFPPKGSECRIVGCSFSNPAVGLLRYDAGDIATVSDAACSCGRPGRIVTAIDGRQEDYILLSNGARISCVNQIFKPLINVREAQIHQRHPGELTVRIAPGKDYGDSDEDRLRHEIRTRLGDDVRVSIDYVDAVERSSTGKIRLVISEVAEQV